MGIGPGAGVRGPNGHPREVAIGVDVILQARRNDGRQGPVSRSPCALLKLDDLTNQCICCMH